jgi:superfamily I DNA/RNA helicase
MTGWRDTLSRQQLDVVNWVEHGTGSLNLVARAGCGKTHTAVRGIVRSIIERTQDEVVLMAFNKSAGAEFKERLAVLAEEMGNLDFLNFKRLQAGTVHSLGCRAVRKWADDDLEIDGKKVANICDRFHEEKKAAWVAQDPMFNNPMLFPGSVYSRYTGTLCRLVSLAKQSAFGVLVNVRDDDAWRAIVDHHGLDEELGEEHEGCIPAIIQAAQRILLESFETDHKVIDFDDMILAPLVHKLKIWPKDWVIIDEAQDTNAARRCLAFAMLKPRTGRLIAIGDDRQAIYGFTGADSDSLDIIRRELHSAVLPLTVTYRCPKSVVMEANRLVPDLVAHESAPAGAIGAIRPTYDVVENGEVVDTLPWYVGEIAVGGEDAILCRNTAPLVETAYNMLAKGIGCRIEGREIGEGLIALAQRWKTPKTLSQLCTKLEEYRDREVKKWMGKDRPDRAQGVEDKCNALITIARALQSDGKNGIDDLVDWIRELFGDSEDRKDVVTLSTIHKAKGREWDRVFFLYRNTTLPSPYATKDWQMLQEANLEYVAITRAKRELIYVD